MSKVVLALAGLLALSRIGSGAPEFACESNATYGVEFVCVATSGEIATYTPAFVGEGVVELVDDGGEVVAEISLTINPDISLECTDRDDDLKKIFQLEATELRAVGWDYVFTDSATGELVRPGDPLHPSGGAEDGLERVLLGEARSTGLCRISSQAAEDLDGEYLLTINSPWEGSKSTPLRIIGPSSKTRWAGTQLAEVTGTVTVNNITASERVDVYQSGCS